MVAYRPPGMTSSVRSPASGSRPAGYRTLGGDGPVPVPDPDGDLRCSSRCRSSSSSTPGCGAGPGGWRSRSSPPSCRSWRGTCGRRRPGTWDFDPDYTVGVTLPGGMAVEELGVLPGRPRLRAAHARVGAQRARRTGRLRSPARSGAAMMPIYPRCRIAAAAAVVALELRGVPQRAVPPAGVLGGDGDRATRSWSRWTGGSRSCRPRSSRYRTADTSGLRPVWDILAEEFVYAFALLTLVILVWDRVGVPTGGTRAVRGRRAHRRRDPVGDEGAPMTGVLLAVAAFVAMEGVSALAHRAVMHGRGHGLAPQPPRARPRPARAQRPVPRCASRPSA